MKTDMKTYLKSARIILEQYGDCHTPTLVLCEDCPFNDINLIEDICWLLSSSGKEMWLNKFISKHSIPVHIEIED